MEGEKEATTMVDPLKEFCDEYSKYLEFPSLTKKQFQNLEDTVESMLARLDEYAAFVETVSADTAKALKGFPVLQEKSAQITKVFPVVDTLEKLIEHIKGTVGVLEERAVQAERQIASLPVVDTDKTPLGWLANKVGTPPPSQAINVTLDQKWVPVNIVNSEEFMKSLKAVANQANQ